MNCGHARIINRGFFLFSGIYAKGMVGGGGQKMHHFLPPQKPLRPRTKALSVFPRYRQSPDKNQPYILLHPASGEFHKIDNTEIHISSFEKKYGNLFYYLHFYTLLLCWHPKIKSLKSKMRTCIYMLYESRLGDRLNCTMKRPKEWEWDDVGTVGGSTSISPKLRRCIKHGREGRKKSRKIPVCSKRKEIRRRLRIRSHQREAYFRDTHSHTHIPALNCSRENKRAPLS